MSHLATLQELEGFDPKELSFGQCKKPDTGTGKAGLSSRPSRVPIRYKGQILKLQSSMLTLPFAWDSDPNITTLTFCTKTGSMSPEDARYADAMLSVLKKVQDASLNAAKENANDWFGTSSETIEGSFSFPLKETDDSKYPPHLKVKYYRDDKGLPQFPVYDAKTMSLIHSRAQPNNDMKCCDIFAANSRHIVIIELSGVWSLNRRGGITWRMQDVLYYGTVQTFPFKGITAQHFNDDVSVYKPLVEDEDEDENFDVITKEKDVITKEKDVITKEKDH